MVDATKLKNGTTFEMNGSPFQVIKYTHQKIGRGGANIKLILRNLKTGDQLERTFGANDKFEEIDTLKKKLQFLYSDSDKATFMDPESFDQVEIPTEVLGSSIKFIKEGQEVNILFWEDDPLVVEIPPKVTLKVAQADPGVKGNSATNIYKSAVLENGLKIKVPLFVNSGDKIRVDTRSVEYIERVN